MVAFLSTSFEQVAGMTQKRELLIMLVVLALRSLSAAKAKQCREGESNSHGLLRTILSRVRLPIPPSRHV